LLQSKFKKKTKATILAKTCVAAATWHIWKERNARVFNLKEQNKVLVFRNMYEDI